MAKKAALPVAKLGMAQDPLGEGAFTPRRAAQLQRGQEERWTEAAHRHCPKPPPRPSRPPVSPALCGAVGEEQPHTRAQLGLSQQKGDYSASQGTVHMPSPGFSSLSPTAEAGRPPSPPSCCAIAADAATSRTHTRGLINLLPPPSHPGSQWK